MTKQIKELIDDAVEIVRLDDKPQDAYFWFEGYLSALMDLDFISIDRFDDLIDEMQNKCGIK